MDIPSSAIPENFVEQVRRALEHLYDLPYLQRHPLAQAAVSRLGNPGETPGHCLRRVLVETIENLNPGAKVFFRSPQARPYHLLHMHCIDGMAIADVAHELGVSERQAYRDLRQGEESVIAILWGQVQTDLPGNVLPVNIDVQKEQVAELPSPLQEEFARLDVIQQPVDLSVMVNRAIRSVEKLAEMQSVVIKAEICENPLLFSTNPVAAQQLLVSLLSQIIQQIHPATLAIQLQPIRAGEALAGAFFILEFNLGADGAMRKALEVLMSDAFIRELIARLAWSSSQTFTGTDCRVCLHIPAYRVTLLVIDDNEGLLDLFTHYLSNKNCQVVSTHSGREGLELALALVPSAVILDIMMPDMDGWEILQRLRSDVRTAGVPVVVCSVVNDPGLAYSLGAACLLPKPVTREKIFSALNQLGLVAIP